MQNEFEKQVQQKMEELQLTPSTPVWENVEKQIRQKKERRRLLFWLPFLILLTGTGFWLVLTNGKKEPLYANERKQQEKNSTVLKGNDNRTKNAGDKVNEEAKSQISKQSKVSTSATKTVLQRPAADKSQTYLTKSKNIGSKKNAETQVIVQKPNIYVESVAEDKPAVKKNNEGTTLPQSNQHSIDLVDSTKKEGAQNPETILPKNEGLKQDTAATKKVEPNKAAKSKWKYAVAVNAGFSGLGEGLKLFNGQKSLDATPNSPSSPNYNYPSKPSEAKKGFSFAVGVNAIKNVSKRFSFLTGLHYKYYSNSITVGRRIDSVLFSTGSIANFYTRTDSAGHRYRNHYHFLSLPIAFNWQIIKKKPLYLQAGFSLQQLIQTNALVFNPGSQQYSKDKGQFHNTQLFYKMGLNYSIPLKQNELTLGPQIEYGLTRLDKTSSGNHLFSFGLNAQLSLKKN